MASATTLTPTQKLERSKSRRGWIIGALVLFLLAALAAGGYFYVESRGLPVLGSPVTEETPTTSTTTDGTRPPVKTESVVKPTTTDDEIGADKVPAELVRANGTPTEKETSMVCEPKSETTPACVVLEKDPCALPGLIKDLKGHFKFRAWDLSHVEDVEITVSTWKHGDTEINLDDYDFWGGRDAANLEAFVRDNRRGYADDAIVVDISETVRYTVFWCECGYVAIYREVKEVYVPPKKKRVPKVPPSDGIPDAWCVDPQTRVKKTCV